MRACQTSNTAVADGIKLLARAKLNLYLELLGKRADGFHEIRTLMQTVELADNLEFIPRDDGICTLGVKGNYSDGVPSDESNLILKAANLLRGALKERGQGFIGADIMLTKNIPHGGGLGGGSSDAAATLQGLAQINDIKTDYNINDNLLFELAAQLGSDVPFFLLGGAALCEGRGEVLTPLKTTGELHVVIVQSAPLSTAEVYGAYAKTARPLFDTPKPSWLAGDTVDLTALLNVDIVNHLEPAAFSLRPELSKIKSDFLASKAASSAMSGSGSCIYGLTSDKESANGIIECMQQLGYEAIATRTGDM